MQKGGMHSSAIAVGVMVLLSGLAVSVRAHKTGAELKTEADCKKLNPPERGHCLECVSRPRPHHFHPGQPAGTGCSPDGT